MKKSNTGIFIFLCIVLLFSMTACQKETPYFKDIHLGMSRDEILEIKKEWGNPQVSKEDYILYQDIKYNDLIGEAEYTFDEDGKLIQSSIGIVPTKKESSTVYEELIEGLSRDYGEGTKLYESTTMWKTEFNGEDNYILCLHDSANKNLSIMLCTPEVYDGIINFESTIAEPYTFKVDNRTLVLEDIPENRAKNL
ncbi:hypothetical protein [Alkalibaculum bacchi]|uniref:hypothetical protein n=1 Tax=Alkalibaculum bacchi TaxID=645887 RepID=UPI0026F21E46|nr:hypothetical protein [Alkalibaculum bacchi]